MSPFFYTILSLLFTNITLAFIFFTAYFRMGKERHTLIWAFTFVAGSLQWLVNIFKPADFITYWMIACSLSVATIILGTWGHLTRTSSKFSSKVLFLSGAIIIAITYYFLVISPHRGLSMSLYIYHTVFYLCFCGLVLLRKKQPLKAAEIGAASIYFLFAIAQGVAATFALMQGAEANQHYLDIYRTINFVSLPTGYIGMSLFIVFILASDMSEKADRANHEKSRFMAAASHDLRQPLNSMGLFLFALRQKLNDKNDESLGVLEHAESAHKELASLFDGILELSRLDSGTIVVENKSVSLNKLLHPIITELEQQAESKGLTLIYHAQEKQLYTDPILLARIMRNLIGNAIKYTEKGKVEVVVNVNKNRVIVDVIDTGIGIPVSEYESIFSEYHQISNKQRDRKEGIGLGLSIVKKISHLLGFEITINSILGKGSTFSLLMPQQEELSAENYIESTHTAYNQLTHTNVLVIDDDEDILVAMNMILSSWQCKVICASNFIEACNLMKNTVPDIILSDYRLQDDMNGIEVLEALYLKLDKSIPSILITADADPLLLKEASEKGLTIINKPVKPIVLQEKMVSLLAKETTV